MSLTDISAKFTTDTLDDIVRKVGGTKHTSFEFGEPFKKGDSYLSKVFRLRVYGINENDGSNVKVDLIVKAMPDNRARRKLFRSVIFFRNEINFYTKVVPLWEQFQAERKPKNPFNEYPKCYATLCDGENDFIALEDITFDGYKAPNRQDYVALEDTKMTMRSLGRFHGVTLALKALDPKKYEAATNYVEETYYAEFTRDWYLAFLRLACIVAKDAVAKTYPDTKYEAIAAEYLQEAELFNDNSHLVSAKSKLQVFCHGDCWTPNFMTAYSSETALPQAMKIIDFQLARCASLVTDLTFFIYSFTGEELRDQHYEDLLRTYHQSACQLIDDLGADAQAVFPWQSLLDEMKAFGRFGCGMGIESLPMSMLDEEEIADLDEIVENTVLSDVWNLTPFKDPKRRERIAQMFKHAIDQGYIK